MRGRNILKLNAATVREALEQYLEELLDEEGVKIDSIEHIDEGQNEWYQLVLVETPDIGRPEPFEE